MPRKRARPQFEFGDHWIANEKGTKKLYHFWTEPGTGRTRRASLGTEDLQKAIVMLVAEVREAAPKTKSSSLGLVLQAYYSDHAANLPSAGVVRSHITKLTAVMGASSTVETLTDSTQRSFVERCLSDGNKLAYAARIMTTLDPANEAGVASDAEPGFGQGGPTREDVALREKRIGYLSHSAVTRGAPSTADLGEPEFESDLPTDIYARRAIKAQVCEHGLGRYRVEAAVPDTPRESRAA